MGLPMMDAELQLDLGAQGTAGGDGVADAEVLGRDFGVGLEGVKVVVFVFGASDANVAGDVGAIQVARDRAIEESRAGEFGGERGGGRAESGQEIRSEEHTSE